ncbi:hypothetical protein NL676_034902 [Syzygium grande]|nr:hypothetical protein NL676_034902 [Syzygium grande]
MDTSLTNLKLSSVKLDGTNYPSWSMAVETYLLATKQLSYLTSPPPSDKAKLDDWRSGDAAIRTLLWNTMDSKISPQFMRCPSIHAYFIICTLFCTNSKMIWFLSRLVVMEAEGVVLMVVVDLVFLLVVAEMVVGVLEVHGIATIVNELAILRIIATLYISSFVHRLLMLM